MVKPEGRVRSNYELIRELTKKLEKEELRTEEEDLIDLLIFYNTLIGAYTARKKYPENFIKERQIVGRVSEAEEIAKQHEKCLKLLRQNSLEKIVKSLSLEAEKIEEPYKCEKELYSCLLIAKGDVTMAKRIGKRVVIRLNSLKKSFGKSSYEREIKKGFCEEQFAMAEAAFYELKDSFWKGLSSNFFYTP